MQSGKATTGCRDSWTAVDILAAQHVLRSPHHVPGSLHADPIGLDLHYPSAPLPLPGLVGNPNPAPGAVGVSRTPTLSWTAGSHATSHNVYSGTTAGKLTFRGNRTGMEWNFTTRK